MSNTPDHGAEPDILGKPQHPGRCQLFAFGQDLGPVVVVMITDARLLLPTRRLLGPCKAPPVMSPLMAPFPRTARGLEPGNALTRSVSTAPTGPPRLGSPGTLTGRVRAAPDHARVVGINSRCVHTVGQPRLCAISARSEQPSQPGQTPFAAPVSAYFGVTVSCIRRSHFSHVERRCACAPTRPGRRRRRSRSYASQDKARPSRASGAIVVTSESLIFTLPCPRRAVPPRAQLAFPHDGSLRPRQLRDGRGR